MYFLAEISSISEGTKKNILPSLQIDEVDFILSTFYLIAETADKEIDQNDINRWTWTSQFKPEDPWY